MTEIVYRGGNYITLQTKQAKLVVDPVLPGQKSSKSASKANVQLITQSQFKVDAGEEQLVISLPGEYEVSDLSISGFDFVSQLNPENKSVAYRVKTPDFTLLITGHINPDKISEAQLEELGEIDVLVVPVGGNGYTMDPHGATKLTGKIGPKIVIPVHFKEDGLPYEVPQQSVEEFVNDLGITVQDEQTLKIKQYSQLPETLTLVKLEKTAA